MAKKTYINLEGKKKNVGERVDKWLELSINTFNFACYARIHFNNAKTLHEKKEILAAVGSNFILQDKIVSLNVLKPFISMRKAKEKTDQLIARFEPSEKPDLASQMMYLYSQNLVLRRVWDDVGTFYTQPTNL